MGNSSYTTSDQPDVKDDIGAGQTPALDELRHSVRGLFCFDNLLVGFRIQQSLPFV